MSHTLDAMATAIFYKAIEEGRAGEIFAHLLNGGSVTIDPNGELALANADQLTAMVGPDACQTVIVMDFGDGQPSELPCALEAGHTGPHEAHAPDGEPWVYTGDLRIER